MKRATFKRFGLGAVVAAGATLLLLGATACTTNSAAESTVDAVLVAPPGVPPQVNRSAPAHVVVPLTAEEEVKDVAPGVQADVWSFNGSVPGPMVRVREGDTVEIRLTNLAGNAQPHNIDFHAANGPGGGAAASTVLPGQTKSFTFKAKVPGLFVYHCAAGNVADHVSMGMYGGILVEPAKGMPTPADNEYYIGQSELYLTGDAGTKGFQPMDYAKLSAEQPTYVVFNGNTEALMGANALQARTNETVRLYMVDGGPNLVSSFHVIGEIFDRVWQYGSLQNDPLRGIQTALVPSGGAAIFQFPTDVPGDYMLVDHSISRHNLGAMGTLHVTGPADPSTFNALGEVGAPSTAVASPTSTAPPASPTATAAPETPAAQPGASATAGAANEIEMDMEDNFFKTPQLTVSAGQKITFELKNKGKVPHNLAIADAVGDFSAAASDLVMPGKELSFDWTAPAATGVYDFICDVHPVQMTGKITVTK